MPNAAAPPIPPIGAKQWKIIFLASIGSSLEWYDFIIYSIFAQYIARQFFPTDDPLASLTLSFSVLAIGYLARPLGGVVLSGLGDRFGRRPVFIISLLSTTLATIAIGLLPSYASWGIAAPVLLVVLRLIQGICLGGELPGAVTYAVEAAPHRPALACSMIILSLNTGVLLATVVNLALQRGLSAADVASYGWRVAFLLGGLIGCVSFVLRRALQESPDFLRMHSKSRNPTGELFRNHRRAVLVGAGISAVPAAFGGVLFGYLPAYLVQTLHYAAPTVALAMTTAVLAGCVGLVLTGLVGDRLPRHLVFRFGTGLLILTMLPIWLQITRGTEHLVLLITTMTVVFAISSALWPSIVANLFPTRVRFSGIALSYNVSITILSGLAPLIVSAILRQTGSAMSPIYYVAACTALSLVASFAVPALTAHRDAALPAEAPGNVPDLNRPVSI